MGQALAINEITMGLESKVGFPIEVFPNEIQHIIMEYQNTLNFPKEFTSASIICAVSSVIGNSLRLTVKRGHIQPIHQFYIVIQERGFKKTAPMNAILSPVKEIDREEKKKYDELKKEYNARKNQAKIDKIEFEEPEPVRKQIVLGRITTESYFQIHRNNPKGLLRFINEARTWFATFNQYSSGADENLQCDIHDGFMAQRSTRSHGTEDLYNPCTTILGAIQPKEITDFIKQNTENGLVDRIIFDYPDYIEDKPEPREEMSQIVIDNWRSIIRKIYNKYNYDNSVYEDNLKSCFINYDHQALERWYEWNASNCIKTKGDNIYRGIVKKAEGNCHRLTMVFQELINVTSSNNKVESISLEAMESAIKVSDHFIEQQIKVRNMVKLNSMSDNDTLQSWFAFLPEGNFATSEAYEIGKKFNKKPRTIDLWLSNSPMIERVKRGIYKKIIL